MTTELNLFSEPIQSEGCIAELKHLENTQTEIAVQKHCKHIFPELPGIINSYAGLKTDEIKQKASVRLKTNMRIWQVGDSHYWKKNTTFLM